jgi:hypothetical protein
MQVTIFSAIPPHRLSSILRNGLLPACSRGKRPEVWLHTASRRPWARAHVARRHKVAPEAVLILRLVLDRRSLVRRGRGLYSCPVVIPPAAIVSVTLPAAFRAAVASV